MIKFGVIGGSGLYDIEGIETVSRVGVETPFGSPSDELTAGTLDGCEIVFLPRHGRGHRILPSELNHRANIFAMKKLGVTHIVSVSAVGSLREEYAPRDVVLVDQYVDRTKGSLAHTFFGNGLAAHISFGDPVCRDLRSLATDASRDAIRELFGGSATAPKVHDHGTYVNMEGPAFSTKAESNLYRSWGMDIIGMTNLPEAKLAREAEICYCTVAMVTDYDCWHPDHDHVTVEMIIANLQANASLAKRIIRKIVTAHSTLPADCACRNALRFARITDPGVIPDETRKHLAPIIGRYYPA
jgi:5'-methylthioadenosine phosphorylase